MAISPNEVRQLSRAEEVAIDRLEAEWDTLLRGYDPEAPAGFRIVLDGGISRRVRQALITRYQGAGWSITHEPAVDPREGDCLLFRESGPAAQCGYW